VVAALEKLDRRPEGAYPAGLVPRLPFLAGREELLAELDARLADGEGWGPRVVALCGLGGAGKASVAVEDAHRHLGEVGVAWQLPAEDAAVLAAGFGELAAQLGTGGAAGGGDPVAAVHSALAAHPGQWLLIIDNAPDQWAVRAFMPPAGNARVLITSQSAIWPPGQAVEVPVLGAEVAAACAAGPAACSAPLAALSGRCLDQPGRVHPVRTPPRSGPAPRRDRSLWLFGAFEGGPASRARSGPGLN
jgi:hypothetical protein